MKVPNLNKYNIQLADLSGHYDIEAGEVFLIYAPLASSFFLADAETVERMERSVESNEYDDEMKELLSQLKEKTVDYERSIVADPSQYAHLSILPNLTCNLSCAYCYSAKGRSKTEIDQDKLKAALDYFIDRERISDRHLTIFISGGGEPLLSWEKILFAIEYSRKRAGEQGFELDIYLMTNGTLLCDNIIDVLKDWDVNVGVSFEILPEVQNSQRGHFEKVSENIKLMLKKGLIPSISSVITDLNVDRISEMAEIINSQYSGVRHLNFDPAMSDTLFPDAAHLDAFYKKFADNFFPAKDLCARYGITLDCNIIRKMEKLFPRYCQGKLCLTPNGKISICHSVSSPKEAAFHKVVYGEVADGHLYFDTDKFHTFIDNNNFLLPRCHSCIARWHCAGGCMMYRMNYDEEKMMAVCRFTSRMISSILLKRLDTIFREEEGISIKELLENRN